MFACDATMMTGIKELMHPTFQLEPLLMLLVERLVHLLNNVHIQSRSVWYARFGCSLANLQSVSTWRLT